MVKTGFQLHLTSLKYKLNGFLGGSSSWNLFVTGFVVWGCNILPRSWSGMASPSTEIRFLQGYSKTKWAARLRIYMGLAACHLVEIDLPWGELVVPKCWFVVERSSQAVWMKVYMETTDWPVMLVTNPWGLVTVPRLHPWCVKLPPVPSHPNHP